MLLRLTSSTLALAVMAAPVFSLTAEEVWQNWETYLTGHGYEVAVGAREDGGDALTLRDVVLRMVDADSEVTSAVTIPLIRMSPTGGADIRSEFPEPLTFRVEGTSGGDDKTVVEGLIDVTASETISREADGRQSDSVTMPEGRIALSSLEIEGDRIEGEPMTLVLRNLRSSATLGGGAGVDGEVEIEGATLLVDMSDVDGKATIRGQGELGAMKLVTRSFLPEGHDNRNPAAMAAALRAGAETSGTGSIASMSLDLDMQGDRNTGDERAEIAFKTSSGPTSIDFGLLDGRLNYQVDASETSVNMQGSEFPVPVDFGIDTVSFDLQFPLLAEDAAQPFKLAYSLGGLRIGDGIWAMADPQGALPHDPADFDLDLTGELILREDLLALADRPDTSMEDMPVLPVSFTLSQLALSAVGASANAQGALRFPEPGNFELMDGELTARFQGINALLDRLVGAGLVGEDEVGGARMMLMMFARPVDGEADTLETRLEVNEEGSIFANGVQIQ